MQQTSLYAKHIDLGGLLVDFAGWKMPLHYGSQLEEHHIVRNDAGIFDVSHMQVINVTGKDAKSYISYMLSNNINKYKSPGKAMYSCLLNFDAGIIDDLIAYYIDDQNFKIVVNAATASKDFNWFQEHSKKYQVTIARTDAAILAIQGPKAIDKVMLLLPDCLQQEAKTLKPFNCIFKQNFLLARTGYTGEDGFEIIMPHTDAVEFWEKCINNNICAIGLGARDTLRLEAGLNLYGQDMDENTSPLAANLAWTVALNPTDRDFIGRKSYEALANNYNGNKQVGLILQNNGILRANQKIFNMQEEYIGKITSGSYSPTLKKSIALACVNQSVEQTCKVAIRDKLLLAEVVKPPFINK